MYEVKVLADSVSMAGCRLTTLEVTFPRFVLAELNTHRMLSRSSASSRAIPVAKLIERAECAPYVPFFWGKNQAGMQARLEVDTDAQAQARHWWMEACNQAVSHARALAACGVHKQLVNRIIEPYLWHTAIVSATEWDNFLNLRCHPDAQPEIRELALMIRGTMQDHEPMRCAMGDWHLPLVPDLEDLRAKYNAHEIARISVARCARVSYLSHDGKRDPQADLDLAFRLGRSGHLSPFEHVARAAMHDTFRGNFRGWVQLRKTIPGEAVYDPATTTHDEAPAG
ncbi:MAG: FAD-dependent thymidylate synthase [Chloroflexi bacterium]|nr:FAD-dependent thymidylate synthase [Chloroflexota bacterium]